MSMQEILASEYKKRIDVLGNDLKDKEKKMKELELTFDELKRKSSEKKMYSVEPFYDGNFVFFYKKGNVVRCSDKNFEFSSGLKDSFLELSGNDFVVFGKTFIDDGTGEQKFLLHDCLYLSEDISSMSWKDRKKLIENMCFSKNIINNGYFLVENFVDTKKAIELIEKNVGVKGVFVKDCSNKFGFGELVFNYN